MGNYPLWVRRDRGVSPRGNSRRARLDPSLSKGGRGGTPRPMGLGLGKRWDGSHLAMTLFIRASFLSLLLIVITQIRGHIAGSSAPLPTTVVAFIFMARRLQSLHLSSTRVESRILTTGALRSRPFYIFTINSNLTAVRFELRG